jgi:PAS domain S-box-containing protein
MGFQFKVVLALSLAVAILVSLAVVSLRKIRDDEKDQEWVDHTRSVIEALGDLQLQITVAESEANGTGGLSSERQESARALEHIPVLTRKLRELMADNQRQEQALAQLAPAVEVIVARATGGDSPLTQSPEATKAHFQILATINDMRQEEQRLLAERSRVAKQGSRRAKTFIALGNVLALAFLLVSAFAIQREMRNRSAAQEALKQSEERFRSMVSGVKDYAILMLDPEGKIVSWNAGAERIKGYRAEEILGQHFSRFYLPDDVTAGKPARELEAAKKDGRVEDEGWRVRKDGTTFWADAVITALRDERGNLRGFGKVTRDLTERRKAEEELRLRNAQLENANKELESFSYSVSHDLRAPLRAIDGFSMALLEDCGASLDQNGQKHLERVRSATTKMGLLIDDMLNLARIARSQMVHDQVNLSTLAQEVVEDLRTGTPDRKVSVSITPNLVVSGDRNLLRIALHNLLGNAWKFTSSRADAHIEFGHAIDGGGQAAFFVKDNGAGFDMKYADKLFGVFQRLHSDAEYSGTGVGLATVHRIIGRHGGRVWAKAVPGEGATFYFVL